MNIARIAAALRIPGPESFAPADITEWRTGWRVVVGASSGWGPASVCISW